MFYKTLVRDELGVISENRQRFRLTTDERKTHYPYPEKLDGKTIYWSQRHGLPAVGMWPINITRRKS